MKRFAVLFGIIALTTVCATTFAEAPSIGDLPALRMVPTSGVVSPLLDTMLEDAYDVYDYIKDANDDIDGLTISVVSVTNIPAPKATVADATGTPTVEINVDTVGETALVDVYGWASPAWFSYVVDVADASTVEEGLNIRETGIAKYSTFAFDGPSIDSGRIIGGLITDPQLFTYVYSEGDLSIASLEDNISPASASAAIAWSAFINEVSRAFDVNGNYQGLEKTYLGDADEGGSVTVDDIMFQVNTDGSLTLTAGASIGMGPWLVGILATDDADDNNADGARVMVARSLLGSVTQTTYGGSETFDDLPLGGVDFTSPNIEIANDFGGATGLSTTEEILAAKIHPTSHWRYQGLGTDTILNMVPLSVVDIAADGAPAAVPGVASGRALKATLTPATAGAGPALFGETYPRADGFRLVAGLFGPTELGEVYTFSASIATDAPDEVSLPQLEVALSSAAGGTIAGGQFTIIPGIGDLVPEVNNPQLPLPIDGEGWMVFSANYTPGSTNTPLAFDAAGAPLYTDEIIASILLEPMGATESINEKDYFFPSLRMWASSQTTATVNVWLDNMRVYKSAYELDLALGPQELEPAELSDPVYLALTEDIDPVAPGTQAFITPPTGWDGTIDSYTDGGDIAADLSDVGFTFTTGWGGRAWGFMDDKFLWASSSVDTIGISSYDHTLNGSGAGKSIVLELQGTDAENSAVYFELLGRPMLATGTGLYAMEVYVSSGGPYNLGGSTPRMPDLKVLFNEVAPNPFGNSFGDILGGAGLPESVSGVATPDNWRRVVSTIYIEEAHLVRAIIQLNEKFDQDASNYNLPLFFDDFKFYKVTDNVDYFDAELFDI